MKKRAKFLLSSLKRALNNEGKNDSERKDNAKPEDNLENRHQNLMISPKSVKRKRRKHQKPKRLQLGVTLPRHQLSLASPKPVCELKRSNENGGWNHRFSEFVPNKCIPSDVQMREISYLKHEIRKLRSIVREHSEQLTYILQVYHSSIYVDRSEKTLEKYGYRFFILNSDLDAVFVEEHGKRVTKNIFNKRYVNVMIEPLVTQPSTSISTAPLKSRRISVLFQTSSKRAYTNSVIGFFSVNSKEKDKFENGEVFVGQTNSSFGFSIYSGSVYHNKVPKAFVNGNIKSGDVIGFEFFFDRGNNNRVSIHLNEKDLGTAFTEVTYPVQICVSIFNAGETFKIVE